MGCTKDPYSGRSDWRTPNTENNCLEFERPAKSAPLYVSVYGRTRAKYVLNV